MQWFLQKVARIFNNSSVKNRKKLSTNFNSFIFYSLKSPMTLAIFGGFAAVDKLARRQRMD